MSFSLDSLRNKLDSLEETQDSIVSTSQWVLFYYRHAGKIVNEWNSYLSTSPQKKKLPLIYLANDVVQQARAKKRLEFIDEFAKVLPTALNDTYRNVPEAIKQKIVKIVKIWKERRIFTTPIEIEGVQVDATSLSSSSKSRPSPQEVFDKLSPEDKLKYLTSSVKNYSTTYHQLLLSNSPDKSEKLLKLVSVIDDTTSQLQDLRFNVEKEVKTLKERDEVARQKSLEMEAKQKELEEKKKEQQRQILAKLLQQKEEESMLPTYDDNVSESDSDEQSEVENTSASKRASPVVESPSTAEEQPSKKLRFAD